LGDVPNQLCRIVDMTEACLHHVQEEKEQDIKSLKQAKKEAIEQRKVTQQEKYDL